MDDFTADAWLRARGFKSGTAWVLRRGIAHWDPNRRVTALTIAAYEDDERMVWSTTNPPASYMDPLANCPRPPPAPTLAKFAPTTL